MSYLAASFSYAQLAPDAERIARASAVAIKAVRAQAIPEIGRHLLAAKAALPHGAFTAWTEAELGINARSARNYMATTEWLSDKPATISVLPPTIIYALAGPAAPAAVINDVLEMAEADRLDVAAIRAKLDAAKIERVELRIAQRWSPNLTAAEARERREKKRHRQELEYARLERKRLREEDERRAKLLPLAERVASLGREVAEDLFATASQYQDRLALAEIVRGLLAVEAVQ